MKSLLTAAALAVATATGACAQTAALDALQAKPFVFPYETEVFDLPTAPNGVDYRLYIRKPLRPAAEGESIASVYFLDGPTLFTPGASMAYNQEALNYIPPAYFIGVGYQENGEDKLAESDRTRDYTPSRFTPDEDHFLYNSRQDWEGSGGAEAFFDYFENTIIPFVDTPS